MMEPKEGLLTFRGAKLRGCNAANFVKKEKESIGEITEYQQLRLFEKTFPEYIIRARNNYNYWTKGKPKIKKWDVLSLPIKNVLTDFVYQGYTKGPRPMMAGAHNDKDELIEYIKNSSILSKDENSRNRVAFLRGEK